MKYDIAIRETLFQPFNIKRGLIRQKGSDISPGTVVIGREVMFFNKMGVD